MLIRVHAAGLADVAVDEEELEELLHITDTVENLEASRIDALTALARSRGRIPR